MKRRNRPPTSPRDDTSFVAASADGVISFRLVPHERRLHVERVQIRQGTATVVQSMLFSDDQSFIRWCDADQLKYSYPLVFANLRRSGCAVLCGQG